jgi:3,4-dihydroxy-2-butanone 4-phosphate synthase
MNDNGSMARISDLERFCAQLKLSMVAVEDVVGLCLRRQPARAA